jgi:hypothetical protein
MTKERTVYVAHINESNARKDLKAAEQYGVLREVFGNVGRGYQTDKMIEHARRVLSDWEHGDSILLIGDPALCGITMAVAAEYDSEIATLSWDRNEFKYVRRAWDLSFID